MLILSRKNQQIIHIGKDIVIHIFLPDDQQRVNIGVSAPKDVEVVRGELVGRREGLALSGRRGIRGKPS